MTVSPEVEELVKRTMHIGGYGSENEVLLAALQALGERPRAEKANRPEPPDQVSPLGMQLREIRAQYVAAGGDVLSAEEFDREIVQRRGERNPGD